MGKQMTEQQVLKKLNIDDFRHLTKDKVIKMASMLDKMDPEVAKKAIEQFPEFASTAKELLVEYKSTIDKGMESNDKSVKSYYDVCNTIINSLKNELEKDNLSFEEKKYVIEQMKEIADKVDQKDTENKRFIGGMILAFGTALVATAGILASTLGGNTQIDMNDDRNDCKR